MAISDPFSITWGDVTVGGTSTEYYLHEPYSLDLSFTSFRLVFTCVVVADSHEQLKSLSDDLETEFSSRDKDVTIDIGGNEQGRRFGEQILNPTSSITKSGDPLSDRGYSRAYSITVEGELPAEDRNGLRELSVNVQYDAGRQRTVTMTGVYTVDLAGSSAIATYQANFDAEATTILAGVGSSATWEQVDESTQRDRNNHIVSFSRQYVELLYNQSQSGLDDANIRDHSVIYSQLGNHPGDATQDVYRFQRVACQYDASVDIEQTTDLHAVVDDTIKPFLKAEFQRQFEPTIFALESTQYGYDETRKRVSVSQQYLYQLPGATTPIVELSRSLEIRENRNVDASYMHTDDELAAVAHPGWAVVERVWTRVVVVAEEDYPRYRIHRTPNHGGGGPFSEVLEGFGQSLDPRPASVPRSGWILISNQSQAENRWIGDPDEDQLLVTVVTESVVDRLFRSSTGGTTTGHQGGPIGTNMEPGPRHF